MLPGAVRPQLVKWLTWPPIKRSSEWAPIRKAYKPRNYNLCRTPNTPICCQVLRGFAWSIHVEGISWTRRHKGVAVGSWGNFKAVKISFSDLGKHRP